MKEKVFIGMSEICGQLTRINEELIKQGVEVTCLILPEYKYGYDVKEIFPDGIMGKYVASYRKMAKEKNYCKKCAIGVLNLFLGLLSFIIVLINYKNIFLVSGDGFFCFFPIFRKISWIRYFDLKIYRLMGKNVVAWFVGSDSRPVYLNGAIDFNNRKQYLKINNQIYNRVNCVERYASFCIDNPAQFHYHKKPYVIFQKFGIPISSNYMVSRNRIINENDGIVILHAPSKSVSKGTDIVRKIVEDVKARGYKINYIELAQVAHSKVMDMLNDADILFDEIYSDTPLGGLGAEAALYNVPVLIGGYYYDKWKDDTRIREDISCYCNPSKLEENLIRLIEDEKYRKYLGAKANEFVKEEWNVSDVSKRLLMLFDGKVKEDWIFDPYKADYNMGYGMSKSQLKKRINSFCGNNNDMSLLLLNDKPEIVKRMYEFCISEVDKNFYQD